MNKQLLNGKDYQKFKEVLLNEYGFFKKYINKVLTEVDTNTLSIQSSLKVLEELSQADLNLLDNIIRFDIEIERINARICIATLNEVTDHELNLKYITRLPSLLFKMNLNKLKIMKKLVLDGRHCKIIHISPDIGLLIHLKELDLSGCLLKQLPEAIVRLENLEVLTLKFNQLTKLPDSIDRLSQLRELDISHNHELQALPKNIGKLKSLNRLIIDHDDLDVLPDEICELENLHEIQAHHNHLRKLPARLERLCELRILDVHNNKLRSLPTSLKKLASLRLLNVQGNQIKRIPKDMQSIAVCDSDETE